MKKIIRFTFTLAILFCCYFFVKRSQQSSLISFMDMYNVEALARGEGDGDGTNVCIGGGTTRCGSSYTYLNGTR